MLIISGQVVEGKLSCRRTIKNLRGLIVTIEIGDEKYQYHFG